MRYPADRKARTREAIVGAAARRFRERGYASSGVDAVMGDAGLTAGGFYSHFGSKEELLAEVLARSIDKTRGELLAGLDELDGEERMAEVVRRYLSRAHRDRADEGCSLPPLAGELARLEGPAREVFGRYLSDLVDELARRTPSTPELGREDRVLGTLSLCVGALLLARATPDRALSDRFLLAGRRYAAATTKGKKKR